MTELGKWADMGGITADLRFPTISPELSKPEAQQICQKGKKATGD